MQQQGDTVTIKRRLIGAFGASVLSPLVSVLVQLINVPVMLRFWGAHLYGEWLLISTIPAYLLLTDFGFGNVAGSDMTMRVHSGDTEGAIESFQSIAAFVLVVSLALGALLTAAIFLLPIHRLLHLTSMSPRQTQISLLFLSINCLVILQWNFINAGYRCAGKYAIALLYVNVIRVLEGVSFLVLLFSHAGPVQLSMLMLGISILGTGWLLFMKSRLIPWLPLGVRHARWQRVRELTQPAIAYMAFPTGSAFSLQGMTMMVGIVLGPMAVAVFNPMRTLSRTVSQLSDAVRISVLVELSAVYGQQNWELARRLHRAACQVSLLLAFLASIALAISGPRIFALWTHGRIVMDVPTFDILLIVVLVNSIWNASSAVPMAANKHQRLAVAYLVCTSAALLVGYPLTRHFGMRGAGGSLLLCEIAMSICVIRMSNKMLADQWSVFAASMIDPTQLTTLLAKLKRRLPGTRTL
jgi:O-antigen/teichoic acid export membrane protein